MFATDSGMFATVDNPNALRLPGSTKATVYRQEVVQSAPDFTFRDSCLALVCFLMFIVLCILTAGLYMI